CYGRKRVGGVGAQRARVMRVLDTDAVYRTVPSSKRTLSPAEPEFSRDGSDVKSLHRFVDDARPASAKLAADVEVAESIQFLWQICPVDASATRSKRSRFITLSHAATKSRTNASCESSHA